jgi:hypothetical protein
VSEANRIIRVFSRPMRFPLVTASYDAVRRAWRAPTLRATTGRPNSSKR